MPLLLAVGGGWYLRTESEFFLVKDLKIDIEFSQNQEALLTGLKPEFEKSLMSLKGQNIWGVSLSQVRKELLTQPWIQDVELARRFPNQIHSLIRLYPVALLYLDSKNRIFPILENGKKMPQTKVTMTPSAPILRNNNILKDPEKLEKTLRLFLEIPQIGVLKKQNLQQVDFNKVTGLSLHLINPKLVVHLGEKNIRTKALRVLRVTDYLQSQKQKARVIDASFTKKVLVRPRKRS